MEDIHLAYDKPVLRGVHLVVEQGQLVVLKGRSGSGKSSLISIAAGLEAPQKGRVLVADQAMTTTSSHVRAASVGMVFQHLHLLGELNVAENVELPLKLKHWPRAKRLARVQELLNTFGLTNLRNRMPSSLSGGEQQRVAIARALAPGPQLLLVDEPTGNLDAENATTVVRALRKAADEGAGVLVATHDDIFDGAGIEWNLVDGQIQ